MEKSQDGDWHVFKEKTRRSFHSFQIEASRGLRNGLAGLVTQFQWNGKRCHITAPGAESDLIFEEGERGWNTVTCRIKMYWYVPPLFFRSKILSDVEQTTIDICGALNADNKKVFIVHGHNQLKRDELASFLKGLELEPVILENEDDRGLTIIEKFEYHASDCAFAFILMTPDDKAAVSGSDPGSRWRARQNVIMEMGWFMAKLGRERVLLLYKGDVEIPSDISGVVYIEFKESIFEVQERIRKRLKGCLLVP